MNLVFMLFIALPQDYINLIMEGKYSEAVAYCDSMIMRGKDVKTWDIEKGDVYLDKIGDFKEAAKIYQAVIDREKKKDGWMYLRLAQALERAEDYLNAAKAYEIVATQYRKAPLDSFALIGVERCFKKNYQDYVATVDGYNITRLELDERIGSATYLSKQDEQNILDQMILERLIYASAFKHEIQLSDFYKEAVFEQRRKIMLEEVKAVDVIQKSTPSEKEMKKYYKKNKENYVIRESVRGKEIIVHSDSLARAILDSLKQDAASFDTLAKLYSTAPTKASGGNIGMVYRGSKPKKIEDALFKAKIDQVIGVVEFDTSYGIYMVTEHTPKKYREFDAVKNQIQSTLKAEKTKELEEKFIKNLHKKGRVEFKVEWMSDSSHESEDVVVAIVNGREILMSDVRKRNDSQPQFAKGDISKPEELRKLLNTMIDEELKVEYGERNKYYLHDGYVAQLMNGSRKLMESGLYKRIVIDNTSVDSQEVKQYYTENKEEFKIPENAHCKEIGVNTLTLAKELRSYLMKNPEQFDSLARENSVLPTGKRGGDAGVIRRGMKSKKYEDKAFKTKVGSFSTVFTDNDSTYVFLQIIERNPASYRPYEEVYRSLETRLLRTKQREVADAFLAKIKEEAKIEIFLAEPEPEGEEGEGETDDVTNPDNQE
jgi:peptidyl-prolyl cis-trans isomerase C